MVNKPCAQLLALSDNGSSADSGACYARQAKARGPPCLISYPTSSTSALETVSKLPERGA
jgi:hypothetical protein